MIIVGLDDTDMLGTRGTGYLARLIAGRLANEYEVAGVVRHQLLWDERVPCTSHNSSASILLPDACAGQVAAVAAVARAEMEANYIEGSDPGLCVAATFPAAVTEFGHLAKTVLLGQQAAWELAKREQLSLQGLGGTNGGVIGALAAVGLAAEGEDGRYVLLGHLRELSGLQPLAEVRRAGVSAIRTLDGAEVAEGELLAEKVRPARRGGRPVLFVERGEACWLPLKLD